MATSMVRRISLALVSTFIFWGCTASGQTARVASPAVERRTLSTAIMAEDLRAHVTYLASDELAGRYPGTEGIERAEEYIRDRFEGAGLDTSFHEFTVFKHGFDRSATTLSFESSSDRRTTAADRDFQPFWFSGTGASTADLVFAGYGITAPEHGYDDYADLDVEGKIVFILRHEPNEDDPESPFTGDEFSRHAFFVTKAETAYEHGAAGLILVTDPIHHDTDQFVIMPSLSRGPDLGERRDRPEVGESFLAVHLTQELGRRLAGEWDTTLEDLQRHVDAGGKPVELDLAAVTASLTIARQEPAVPVEARNVLGTRSTPGASAWIVFGAHHDHLGTGAGAGDRIFNGADDNASGVAALLELAAGLEEVPGFNLAFITFSAEEQGLFGSRIFVEEASDDQATVPIEEIELMVNFDMIGRNSGAPVNLYVGRLAAAATTRLRELATESSLAFDFNSGRMRAASDHSPFYEAGVPVMSFFTGTHDDYHQPGDSAEKLDYRRMAEIVSAAARMVGAAVADSETASHIRRHPWLIDRTASAR